VSVSGEAKLDVGGKAAADTTPLSFSSSGAVKAPLVLAGYGIEGEGWDDYKGVDVKDKIVVVRRFAPEQAPFDKPALRRKHGDLERKARLARERGAKGLIVVDYPARPRARSSAGRCPTRRRRRPSRRRATRGSSPSPAHALRWGRWSIGSSRVRRWRARSASS
jgi:hypothetical protein